MNVERGHLWAWGVDAGMGVAMGVRGCVGIGIGMEVAMGVGIDMVDVDMGEGGGVEERSRIEQRSEFNIKLNFGT